MSIHEVPYGITRGVAEERGYRRITSVQELEEALREDGFSVWKDGEAVCAKWGATGTEVRYGPDSHLSHLPWMLYPTHWRVGESDMVVGHEVRFETPVTVPVIDPAGQPTGETRTLRYRGPQKAPVVMDCPARFQPLLANATSPLIITEGVKKVDTIASFYARDDTPTEVCSIALRGVAMWSRRDAQGNRVLLPQWDDVTIWDREILLLFDSDVSEKQAVQHEMRALGEALTERGGKVFWSPIPAGNGQKIGVDDFLIAGGRLDDLQAFPVPPLTMRRMRVNIGGGDLRRMSDEAWSIYAGSVDKDSGKLLVRGSDLAYYSDHENGFVEYRLPSLKGQLSSSVDFGKFSATGRWSSVTPPDNVASEILARDGGDYPGAAYIQEARSVPFLGSDEKFVTTKGVHESVYFSPHPKLNGGITHEVPTTPYEVEDAVGALDSILGDFVYKDQASRANAYALLMTPFVKPYIDGPCPLFNVTGPDKGQGKTMLCWTALAPSCGMQVDEQKVNEDDDDELRKSITSQMRKGVPAIVLGNMNGEIRSMLLAAALTASTWTDRVLGESTMFQAPINHIWVINGRNVRLSDELQDRAVTIILDAKGENLRRRSPDDWRHNTRRIHDWALQERNFSRIVSAVATLIEHWLAGEFITRGHYFVRDPSSRVLSEVSMGSFDEWSRIVGGILNAAGIKGFLGNLDSFDGTDDDRTEAGEFLEAWYGQHLEPLRLSEFFTRHCSYGSPLHALIPTKIRSGSADRTEMRLRYFVGEWRGTNLNGYQLVGEGPKNKALQWKVEKISSRRDQTLV